MKVTVLMPVYNGQRFLNEAIESILNQSFSDFEFIIINDGSSDRSSDIIEFYSKKDKRIKLINNGSNLSLVPTLNKGLDLALGEYIIRMDCDDVSLPNRIEEQVSFMEKNSDVGISGTWSQIIDHTGNTIRYWKNPTSPEEIKAHLLFGSPLCHPSVIIRKAMLERFNLKYEESYKHMEDYALWVKSIEYFPIKNIPKVLIKYREINTSITRVADKNIKSRFEIYKLVCHENLRKLGFDLNEDTARLHFSLGFSQEYGDNFNVTNIKRHLDEITSRNSIREVFDSKCLADTLGVKWIKLPLIVKDKTKLNYLEWIYSRYFRWGIEAILRRIGY